MIREQAVYRGELVSLMRYDHPAGRTHRDPAEETSSYHSITFIERGAFDLYHRGRRRRMDPSTLFVTTPGLSYRCTHAAASPDDVCLSIHLDPRLVEEAEAEIGRGWTRDVPAAPVTNRLAWLRDRLAGSARDGEAAMAAPALAGELLAALADPGGRRAVLWSAGRIALYARRIGAAREMLEATYPDPHSLEATARSVGMSPFHFSRVFRALVGAPPHRFLLGVRLKHAARRLADGAGVTETCHATGFNNLSHFIRTFRRVYGVRPSRYRP
jgi:AraC family transcriptional regulator